MDYTIEKLKQTLFNNVFEVYDIFKNHFKEKYVDLHGIPSDNELLLKLQSPIYHKDVQIHGVSTDKAVVTISEAGITSLKNFYCHFFIYVWWPKVTITNEHNKSIDIQDLYAEIMIDADGCIPYEYHGFLLNRATYPAKQFDSDYLHSHISRIPIGNFNKFQTPCLGRGPIKQTIVTLKSSNDSAMWMLFCEELSRYVTVESLTGIPYRRLESVGYRSLENFYQDFSCRKNPLRTMYDIDYKRVSSTEYQMPYEELKKAVKCFTVYYLKHGHLKFSYTQGKFTCGMSFFNFIVDISNCFIAYYNAELAKDKKKVDFFYRTKMLNDVLAADGKIYKLNSNTNTHQSRYNGVYILTFKGENIRLKILEDRHSTTQKTVLIHYLVAQYILDSILNIINFRFTNEYGKNTKGSSKPAKARKTVYYV